MESSELKEPAYEIINPNGKVPAIVDPNTDIVLWESGAIIQYLLSTYDPNSLISFATTPEKYQIAQWLFFQASGQGPYFGQAYWFEKHYSEHLPSAIERYRSEVLRILGVLNKALVGKEYLVGGKCTAADLAFLTWAVSVPTLLGEKHGNVDLEANFPDYFAWIRRLRKRPAVVKVFADKENAIGAAN